MVGRVVLNVCSLLLRQKKNIDKKSMFNATYIIMYKFSEQYPFISTYSGEGALLVSNIKIFNDDI